MAGADMALRDLYLPGGTTLDLAAVKEKASDLCRHASIDELKLVLDHADLSGQTDTGDDEPTDDELRHLAETHLHQRPDDFAACLHHRDVARYRFDRPADGDPSTADGGGADAYVTGGLSHGDSPTASFEAWDVFDHRPAPARLARPARRRRRVAAPTR